eukprot:Opistho-2@29788
MDATLAANAKTRGSAKRSSNSRTPGSRRTQKSSGKSSRRRKSSASDEENDPGYTTRCICGFKHNDEFMICCDKCNVWQHMDCMGIDRGNVPSEYFCEACQPRVTNPRRAAEIQRKKIEELSSDELSADDAAPAAEDAKRRRSSTSAKPASASTVASNGSTNASRKRASNASAPPRKRQKPSQRTAEDGDGITINDDDNSASDEDLMAWEESGNNPFLAPYIYISKNNYDAWTPAVKADDEGDQQLEDSATSAIEVVSRYELAQSAEAQAPIEGPSHGVFGGADTDLPQVAISLVDAKGSKGARQRRGLFAEDDIESGRLIVDFRGRVLAPAQLEQVLGSDTKPLVSRPYPFALFFPRLNVCIDGTMFGSEARFVRRSCTPNAETRDFHVDGKVHVGVFALYDICRGDEVTVAFDYAFDDKLYPIECACDLESCLVKESNERRRRSGIFDDNRPRRKKPRLDSVDAGNQDGTTDGHPNGLPVGESKRRRDPRRRKSLSPAGETTEGSLIPPHAQQQSLRQQSQGPADDGTPHDMNGALKPPASGRKQLSRQQSQDEGAPVNFTVAAPAPTPTPTPTAGPRGRSGSNPTNPLKEQQQQPLADDHADDRFLSREERKLQAILRQIEKMENVNPAPSTATPSSRKDSVGASSARKRGLSMGERDLSPNRKRARSQPQTPMIDRDSYRDDAITDTLARQRGSRRPSTGSQGRTHGRPSENGMSSGSNSKSASSASSSSSSSSSSESESESEKADANGKDTKPDAGAFAAPKFGKKAWVKEFMETGAAAIDVKPVSKPESVISPRGDESVAIAGKKAWIRDWTQPQAQPSPAAGAVVVVKKEEETPVPMGGKFALKKKVLSTFYGDTAAAASSPPPVGTSVVKVDSSVSDSADGLGHAHPHTHLHPRPLDLSSTKEVLPSTPQNAAVDTKVEPEPFKPDGDAACSTATDSAPSAPQDPIVASLSAGSTVEPITPTKKKVSLGDYLKRRTSTTARAASEGVAASSPVTATQAPPSQPPLTPVVEERPLSAEVANSPSSALLPAPSVAPPSLLPAPPVTGASVLSAEIADNRISGPPGTNDFRPPGSGG